MGRPSLDVAVVGATGAVGETILRVLEERRLPIEKLVPFASRARDAAVRFDGGMLDVLATDAGALENFDVVFFAGGEELSDAYAPALVRRGRVVIDNSAAFRLQDGIPLIVPDVNPNAFAASDSLFPVGNCTAIILCSALAPIRDAAGLRSVRVATYQAASGAGRAGLDELYAGERAAVAGEDEPPAQVFPRSLARNVVPQVGAFDASGYSGEERKVRDETRKILGLPELFVSVTAVRVPVRTAHAEALFVETERPVGRETLALAFAASPSLVFHDDGIVTPRDVEGTDRVHVARLRHERDGTQFALWCAGDQLRKGAATTAVEILELLLAAGRFAA
jgi:aspartate-semialdehyde dehydrogenase